MGERPNLRLASFGPRRLLAIVAAICLLLAGLDVLAVPASAKQAGKRSAKAGSARAKSRRKPKAKKGKRRKPRATKKTVSCTKRCARPPASTPPTSSTTTSGQPTGGGTPPATTGGGSTATGSGSSGSSGTTVAAGPRPGTDPATKLFGFNENAVGQGLVTADQLAGLDAGVGANVDRMGVPWQWIERQPGQYDWRMFDRVYAALRARGIRPVLIPVFTPLWALPQGVTCDPNVRCVYPPAPAYDDAWGRFVGLLAARYPQAAAIEIWNEPNIPLFWAPRPDPVRYTQLLKRGYAAVKAAVPSMTVLGGGIGGLDNSSDGGISVRDFLNGVYAAGGGGYMDAISLHPYGGGFSDSNLFRTLDQARDARDANGDVNKHIWVTEVGASTSGPPGLDLFSEADQARVLVHRYRALGSISDVDAVIVHTLVEPPGTDLANNSGPGFGIVRQSLDPKPAYCALAAARATGYSCPTGVSVPSPDAEQEAEWAAQDNLHRAWDAAREQRTRSGSFAGLLSALPSLAPGLASASTAQALAPGNTADPTRIQIWVGGDGSLLLCNASRARYSYCLWYTGGRARFGKSTSTTFTTITNLFSNENYW